MCALRTAHESEHTPRHTEIYARNANIEDAELYVPFLHCTNQQVASDRRRLYIWKLPVPSMSRWKIACPEFCRGRNWKFLASRRRGNTKTNRPSWALCRFPSWPDRGISDISRLPISALKQEGILLYQSADISPRPAVLPANLLQVRQPIRTYRNTLTVSALPSNVGVRIPSRGACMWLPYFLPQTLLFSFSLQRFPFHQTCRS